MKVCTMFIFTLHLSEKLITDFVNSLTEEDLDAILRRMNGDT